MNARHRKLALLLVGAALALGTQGSPAWGADAPQYTGGALEPTELVAASSDRIGVSLPETVDLQQWAPAVGDQGRLSSCVTWAIDYGLLGCYAKHDNHAGAPFAPMYTYSQIKQPGGGSYSRDAFSVAYYQGNDTRAHYRQGDYDDQTLPDAGEVANATHYKISRWNTLFARRMTDTPDPNAMTAIKTALALGKPVAIGLPLRQGFDYLTASGIDNDVTTPHHGGHVVMALGYNASGLLIQNSWGTDWGNGGRGRLSWLVVQRDVYEAYTIDGFAFDPNPPLVNHAPTATAGTMGLRAGQSLTRSVASLASDPDGDQLTYELIQIGFGANQFNFSWNSATGAFNIKVPAGNGASSTLKFRVKDPSGAVSAVVTVNLDFVK